MLNLFLLYTYLYNFILFFQAYIFLISVFIHFDFILLLLCIHFVYLWVFSRLKATERCLLCDLKLETQTLLIN